MAKKSIGRGRKGQSAYVDFSDLLEFQEQLEALDQKAKEEFMQGTVNEIAARLLAKVVKRTPVGQKPEHLTKAPGTIKITGKSGKKRTFASSESAILQEHWAGYVGGELRRNWTAGSAKMEAGVCKASVTNSKQYASYVEYGHRQTPGRFVPALGRRLKKGWVKGKFMMTKSRKELEPDIPGIIRRRFKKFMEGAFNVK